MKINETETEVTIPAVNIPEITLVAKIQEECDGCFYEFSCVKDYICSDHKRKDRKNIIWVKKETEIIDNKSNFDSKHALLLAGKLSLAIETLLKETVIESVHNKINVVLALRQYNDYIFKHTKI